MFIALEMKKNGQRSHSIVYRILMIMMIMCKLFIFFILLPADVQVNRRWLTKFSNDLVTEKRSVNAENITDDERYFTRDNRHSTSKFNLICSRLSLNLHMCWTSKLSHCLFFLLFSFLSFLCSLTFSFLLFLCHTFVSERLFYFDYNHWEWSCHEH